MKRIWFLCVILIALIALPVSATSSFFGGNLSFDWYAADSLFPESIADPMSSVTTLHVLNVLEGQPRTIRVEGADTYDDAPIYTGDKYADETLYLQVKTGVNLGLFRWSFQNYVQAEFTFQGALNSVFQGFGGADNLGFDGIFFVGTNVRFFDIVALRFGLRHYSGHYGDETLENMQTASSSTATPIEYCRDNNLLAGISVFLGPFVRIYADVSKPLGKSWMHPAVHIPSWVLKETSGQPLYLSVSEGEGITAVAYPSNYKAWIIQTGAELKVALPGGALFLASDVKLHQDGQTKHMPGQYSEQNPWEQEYTVGGGLEFDQTNGDRKARIEVYYHSGRFPLLNFFYQRTSYVSVVFGISG
ncbi:MAG: hypothetical protein ACQ5SW_05760 [Sphaerochaetaceae bacterium]